MLLNFVSTFLLQVQSVSGYKKQVFVLFLIVLGFSNMAEGATYYVNDNSTTGDRWCSAVGNDANNGTAANTPKLTLSSVLSTYDLGAGDIVRIDHGTYSWATIDWSSVASNDYGTGTGANVLTIQGAGNGNTAYKTNITSSTNELFYFPNNSDTYDYITFDGMYLTAASTKIIFWLGQPDYITISNCVMTATGAASYCIFSFNAVTNLTVQDNELRVKNSADRAIYFNQGSVASDALIQRNKIDGVNGSEALYGIYDDQGVTNLTIKNNFISNFQYGIYRDQNSANTLFYHNSFYCKNYCIYLGAGAASATVKDNIMYCYGSAATDYCLYMVYAGNAMVVDYNVYHKAGSYYVRWNNTDYATLAAWQGAAPAEDANSLTGDPTYVSATGGNLAITGGPASNAGITGFATDDVTSGSRGNPPEIGAFEIGSLPVELLSFEANCNSKNELELSWSTASEINNDFFTIERSQDLKQWEVAFDVKGAGNSNQILHYDGIDQNPFPGVSYYRLKQTDFDSRFEYSDIVSVSACDDHEIAFSIYPNPSSGIFSLIYSGNKNSVRSIEVMNALGQNVYRLIGYSQMLDLSDLPEGIYFIRMQSNTTVFSGKIEVIK
ncbi:MAG: T9SS type A sorting domain-containing protein [Flavobacteriales bacterium]